MWCLFNIKYIQARYFLIFYSLSREIVQTTHKTSKTTRISKFEFQFVKGFSQTAVGAVKRRNEEEQQQLEPF
jgi:hypothetical protein